MASASLPDGRRYLFGPYGLDPARRVLTRDDATLPITGKAFDVLLALVERRGRTVEKSELLELVWADATVQEANLSQQIFTIRRLLGETPDHQSCIATIPRRGYRFVADVREARESAAEHAAVPLSRSALAAPMQLALHLPPGSVPALSPSTAVVVDAAARFLVYVTGAGGTSRLCVRALDRLEPQPLAGTDGAVNPFLSPDGEWVGYVAQGRLHKRRVSGGVPSTLCEVDGEIRGATWTSRGEIVFAPGPASGLWRVAAAGGAPRPLTTLAFDAGERTHRWPHALPDGAHVILTIGHAGAASFDEATLAVVSLTGDGPPRPILRHGTDARYVDGHLLYAREAAIMAAPFDPDALAVRGAARPLISGVATAATGAAAFGCSHTGVLVHAPGEAQTLGRRLVRVRRDGTATSPCVRGDGIEEPRLAADGRRAILGLRGRTTDLWLHDFVRRTLARLTFDGDNFAGACGPTPDTITFSSNRGGACDLYCVKTGELPCEELLLASAFDKVAGSWSSDGSLLTYTEYHPETGADLWTFDRASGETRPLVRTRFNEYGPAVSPNGRHVAYTSDETGRVEVYVTGLPGVAGKWQISVDGGSEPLWSRDGSELFYRSGDRLMCVDMRRGPSDAGVPVTLFEGRYIPGTLTGLPNYDVDADGASFLLVAEDTAAAPADLLITIDCFSQLG
jgi:serine/threonine-protein kinase